MSPIISDSCCPPRPCTPADPPLKSQSDIKPVPELEHEPELSQKGKDLSLTAFAGKFGEKLKGVKPKRLPVPPVYQVCTARRIVLRYKCVLGSFDTSNSAQMVLSFIGAFGSLLVIAGITLGIGNRVSLPLLLAPFGASTTLLFVRGS